MDAMRGMKYGAGLSIEERLARIEQLQRPPILRMKVGSVAVNNATGNQAVTGVGFKPALVRLTAVNSADTANPARGVGAMDSAGNQWSHTLNSAGTAHDRYRTTRCIYLITAAGVVAVEASYVSMDTDGFTINIVREDLGVGATILLWEAYY